MEFNNAFFEQLGKSPEVTALVESCTEEVAAAARAGAPVGATEDYRNGIKTQMKYQRRAVGLVIGTDRKTMIIESKTGNLVRAVRTVGRGK